MLLEMINLNKVFIQFLSDLEESSPSLKKSLNEISPVEFCLNIKGYKKIYIKYDGTNSHISFHANEHQFEINGTLTELLNLLASRKLNKNLINGDAEKAIVFANIILKSIVDLVYIIDKYFGSISSTFVYSLLKLFSTSDKKNLDKEYVNIQKKLRDISIRLDRLEAIKQI